MMSQQNESHGTASDMNNALKEIYYNPVSASAFSSSERLLREAKRKGIDVNKKDVDIFLSSQFPYTLYHRYVKRFKRNATVAMSYGDLAQADLVDVTRYAGKNKGIKYLLTLIDVFTRLSFVEPLKTKSGIEVCNALERIFRVYRPNNLETDAGKEFLNRHVQSLLQSLFVNYFVSHNEAIKCSIIERYQRTLMQKIEKLMCSKGNQEYIKDLNSVVEGINRSHHRTLGMSPIEAANSDKQTIFRKLYGCDNERELLKHQARKKFRFTLGDHVRVPLVRQAFRKGYMQTFSDELYKVVQQKKTGERPTYVLENYDGERVRGSYYEPEMVLVSNSDLYRVHILRTRMKKGKKEYLVRYVNFPDQKEWIPASRLESIK